MKWILPVMMNSFMSLKDKTLKVTFLTQEMTPEQQQQLFSSMDSFGFMAFKEERFSNEDREIVNLLECDYNDNKLTASQQQRNVLYRCWQVKNEGHSDFKDYYKTKMKKIKDHFLTLLKEYES